MYKRNPCVFRRFYGYIFHFFSVKHNCSGVFVMYTCENIHKRRFSSSILSQKCMNLSRFHPQRNFFQHLYAIKGFAYSVHL